MNIDIYLNEILILCSELIIGHKNMCVTRNISSTIHMVLWVVLAIMHDVYVYFVYNKHVREFDVRFTEFYKTIPVLKEYNR